MMNYKNPGIVLLSNPTGIDKAIQEMQVKLGADSSLSWLEKIFGRAIVQKEAISNKEEVIRLKSTNQRVREIIYPEGYLNQQEPINLMCNDNLKAYSFFVVRDPGETISGGGPFEDKVVRYPVWFLVWMNLKKIDPNKDYRFGEEKKIEVLKAITKLPNFTLSEVYEEYDRVFEDFTLTETYRQFLKPPYYGFRLSGFMSVTYETKC